QRQVLAAGFVARDRAIPGPRYPQVFPRRLRVRPPEVVRVAGTGSVPVRHPTQGQPRSGAEDRRWMTRPVGRPSGKPKVFYHGFRYRAGSWGCDRRVVAKIAWHAGELFPRDGFIVTNLKWRSKRVV